MNLGNEFSQNGNFPVTDENDEKRREKETREKDEDEGEYTPKTEAATVLRKESKGRDAEGKKEEERKTLFAK